MTEIKRMINSNLHTFKLYFLIKNFYYFINIFGYASFAFLLTLWEKPIPWLNQALSKVRYLF